jgi:hypothetical protein
MLMDEFVDTCMEDVLEISATDGTYVAQRARVTRITQQALEQVWVADEWDFRQVIGGTTTLAAGDYSAVAPSGFMQIGSNGSVWIQNDCELQRADAKWVNKIRKQNGTNRAKPQYYAVAGQDSTTKRPLIIFDAISDAAYTIELDYERTCPTLVDVEESLTNGNLTDGLSWSATGDFALTSNAATYTHSTGVGTFLQTSAAARVPWASDGINATFTFTYTVSSVTGTPVPVIPNTFALTQQSLEIVPGTYTLEFTGKATTLGDFKISCTSATTATITFDNLSLRMSNEATNGLDIFPDEHARSVLKPAVAELLLSLSGDGRVVTELGPRGKAALAQMKARRNQQQPDESRLGDLGLNRWGMH